METKNLADLHGAPPVDWKFVTTRLERGVDQVPGTSGPGRHTFWLTTLNPDGSPHVTGLGALWVHDTFWFETGGRTRKGRNLARDPRCALSVSTDEFDLVAEGRAAVVEDPGQVADLAARWAADGWPCSVDASGTALTAEFSAPSAGRPPWQVHRMEITSATALQIPEPYGCTRWRF
ncbi:pyridoxamine 5'-phosphate oxidase family protein [Kineococcus sp. SYSU DK003]|uniref:pyridoxamine 5'-phosphate oxidase family protein n=1 Tax=Kineococcus sp. SYSU DK003 TaxID=3383124 RepID=UPI003D7D7E77